MWSYPEIDPVAFAVGPLQVHWYGIMYLLGFVAAWLLARSRCRRPWSPVQCGQVEDLIVYAAFGVIIGGRFGYVLFYNLDNWLSDPLFLFRIWEGGMSFHGGLLGVVGALWLFGRRRGQSLAALGDFVAPLVPIGLGLGRLGNFIGQELWGRPTDGWWGMVFPADPQQLPRHPSQLYEMFLEGIVLFAALFWFSRKPRPAGAVSGLFLVLYGLFRFVVEFVREPDSHLADQLLFGWMTRGQALCLPMLGIGLILLIWTYRRAARRAAAKTAANV